MTAYAGMAVLSGWLHVPLRHRWPLVFFMMAHRTAAEMGQWTMPELHWSRCSGELHDVAYDNVGVLAGRLEGVGAGEMSAIQRLDSQ